MSNDKTNVLNILKYAGALIAFLIGSGFATGQEVLQYFAAYGLKGFYSTVFIFISFCYVSCEFMTAGFIERFEKPGEVFEYYCGKYIGKFYSVFTAIFISLSFIVMISGAGAALHQYYHIPNAIGAVLLAVLSTCVVVLGLGKIIGIMGTIGPLKVAFVAAIGTSAAILNASEIPNGALLIESGSLSVTRVGTNWFSASLSYIGFCILWLATFLSAMGKSANNKNEIKYSMCIGSAGFSIGLIMLLLGILAFANETHNADIPTLTLAQKVSPMLATLFIAIVFTGLFSTCVPLLWSSTSHFAQEKTKKFTILAVVMSSVSCFIALHIQFRKIVNIVYGINGYVGIILIIFMIVKTVRRDFLKNNSVTKTQK